MDKSKYMFKHISQLPAEICLEIAKNLPNRELNELVKLSTYDFFLFQPMLDIRKFLLQVINGNYVFVQQALEKDISLIFKKGRVIDKSNREFASISGFEYAIWSHDKFMWETMINCIPQNSAGVTVFSKLLTQYDNILVKGIEYQLEGKKTAEAHFDLGNTLIVALQRQLNLITSHVANKWDACDKQWREEVGGAQRLLPRSIVAEYCAVKTVHPPNFASEFNQSTQFYDFDADNYQEWFSADSKLGIEFALCWSGSCGGAEMCQNAYRMGPAVKVDLEAMLLFEKVRIQDFIALKLRLADGMVLAKELSCTAI